ncbi:MAG TPA: PKD domain-containing protein [Vicinamibacteria bacterium]|nr:PKD domain-containing protein [Vicinamibacteria bacterium]
MWAKKAATAVRWSELAVAVGLILCLGPAQRVDARSTPVRSSRPSHFTSSAQLSSSGLPLAARAAISANLGKDRPAYHALARGGLLSADNPAHSLRAEFTAKGVRVFVGAASFGLALRGYGYGSELRPATTTEPWSSANRVEYRRGPLTEWYVNGPLGMEQGFTLEGSPGQHRRGPLTIEIALSGDLVASIDPGGRGLTMKGPGRDSALRYTGLVANDANHRDLPVWLELRNDTLLLRVNDADARYPIVVDPLVQTAKLTASDAAAGDLLGNSVAISGDTIVVGAIGDDIGENIGQGSAYVFVKGPTGWADMTQAAKLTASDGSEAHEFGTSVAIDGDTVVVGARHHQAFGAGSAYVFVKPASGWGSGGDTVEDAILLASDAVVGDQFGISVGISGDTVVVGAYFDDGPGGVDQGSAYVFVEPVGGWTYHTLMETAKLTASDGAAQDRFGKWVAIDGDTVVVGANLDDVGANANQGSAYVFVKPGGGWATTSSFDAKLTASDGLANDLFGWSVAVSGEGIVVGAIQDAPPTNGGSAYVFVTPAGGWSGSLHQSAKLTASDAASGAFFGRSVAASGSRIAVASSKDAGSVYVFDEPAGGWSGTLTQTEKLSAAPLATAAATSVATSGSTIVAGAPGYSNPNGNQGVAYVFEALGAEVCDGVDNDLDGLVDEGFLDTDGDDIADCVDTDDDADGIADTVDKNRTTGADESLAPSNDFNDGTTSGTITEGDGTITIHDISPDGVRAKSLNLNATSIETCHVTGPELVKLNGADVADITCVTTAGGTNAGTQVTAVVLTETIDVRKPPDGSGTVAMILSAGDTVTVGSPIAAGVSNVAPIEVDIIDASDNVVGFLELPAGQTVGIEPPGPDGEFIVTNLSDPGTPPITVTAGGVTTTLDPGETIALSSNDPPVVDAGGPYSGNEGTGISLNGLASDSDGDPLSLIWAVSSPSLCSFSDATVLNPTLTCNDNGNYTVTLTAEDGVNPPVSFDANVTVANVAPNIALAGAASVDEGSAFTLSLGAVLDPGDDTVMEYIVDWGDSSTQTFLAGGDVNHTYADGPASRAIIVALKDEDGTHSGAGTLAVEVNNVPPAVLSVSVPLDPTQVGTPVNASASFVDPAATNDEPYTCTVDYDDGSGALTGTVSGTTCTGPAHSYSTPGVYTVSVRVTDKDGGSRSAQATEFIVIFDPGSGFVTGGGFIDSPWGAFTANPDLTGKANFGFVSKYTKGAPTPTGQTEFQFKVANLNFHSDVYEWLVVTGHKAMYKGTGTVNGGGDYGFLLSAIDAALTPSRDVDGCRIKIWDKDNGDAVVYDNELGADEDAEPSTDISGGNITIHDGKGK